MHATCMPFIWINWSYRFWIQYLNAFDYTDLRLYDCYRLREMHAWKNEQTRDEKKLHYCKLSEGVMQIKCKYKHCSANNFTQSLLSQGIASFFFLFKYLQTRKKQTYLERTTNKISHITPNLILILIDGCRALVCGHHITVQWLWNPKKNKQKLA